MIFYQFFSIIEKFCATEKKPFFVFYTVFDILKNYNQNYIAWGTEKLYLWSNSFQIAQSNCSLLIIVRSNCQIVRSKKTPTEWAAGIFYSCPAKFKTGIIFLPSVVKSVSHTYCQTYCICCSYIFFCVFRYTSRPSGSFNCYCISFFFFQKILKDSSKLK